MLVRLILDTFVHFFLGVFEIPKAFIDYISLIIVLLLILCLRVFVLDLVVTFRLKVLPAGVRIGRILGQNLMCPLIILLVRLCLSVLLQFHTAACQSSRLRIFKITQ